MLNSLHFNKGWNRHAICHIQKELSNSSSRIQELCTHESAICTCIRIYVCIYIYIGRYIYIYLYGIHICIHIFICIIFVCIRIYIYTCTCTAACAVGKALCYSVYMCVNCWLQGAILLMFSPSKLEMAKTYFLYQHFSVRFVI